LGSLPDPDSGAIFMRVRNPSGRRRNGRSRVQRGAGDSQRLMKIISSKKVYKCDLFSVTEDHASDGKGYEIRRSIVRHAGSAVMMAVDDKKRILLVRQYRLPAERSMWELPAGRLDPGEKPLQAAKRELAEETGCRARIWK